MQRLTWVSQGRKYEYIGFAAYHIFKLNSRGNSSVCGWYCHCLAYKMFCEISGHVHVKEPFWWVSMYIVTTTYLACSQTANLFEKLEQNASWLRETNYHHFRTMWLHASKIPWAMTIRWGDLLKCWRNAAWPLCCIFFINKSKRPLKISVWLGIDMIMD